MDKIDIKADCSHNIFSIWSLVIPIKFNWDYKVDQLPTAISAQIITIGPQDHDQTIHRDPLNRLNS